MEALGLYMLKSALCSAAFLGIYLGFFRKETFYSFNRYFLTSGLLCSLLLPFYTYTYDVVVPAVSGQLINIYGYSSQSLGNHSIWIYVVLATYGLGLSIFILRHILGFLRINKVISAAGYSMKDGYKLVQANNFKSSFSYFNYIILDGSAGMSETERNLIMEHELAHVYQQHWVDLLLAQLVCLLQWFNPLVWLYLRTIKENHEFLADEAVLKQGNSPAIYRAVLVNHCIGTRVFSFSSSFYRYQFSRLKMLTKPASGPFKKLCALAVLPLTVLVFWAFAKPVIKVKESARIAINLPSSKGQEKDRMLAENVVAVQESIHPEHDVVAKQKVIAIHKVKAVSILDTASKAIVMVSDKVVVSPKEKPLYLLDGVEIPPAIDDVDQSIIESIHVLKGEEAVAAYGERGRNGVIMIYTKKPNVTID